MSLASNRTELRKRLRGMRSQLSPSERFAAADALLASLEQLPEFLVDPRIAGYWAVAGEMPLHAVFANLRARDQVYCLPIVTDANVLRFAAWKPGAALRNNRYGIPEPDVASSEQFPATAIDVVLLPLTGFDRRGNRLGMGAGYYDRSFAFLHDAQRPARPVLIGIGYHFQELPEIAPEPWDIKLDFVATDRELIDCTPKHAE
ncbi:MAG TPA: 5-formyltetrahydrofolate cyclo-ligase [Burkholderiales bacterium]|nr:5-formyltetrahydrofolate cyclo-ligase [Burkholderiales bacterium]